MAWGARVSDIACALPKVHTPQDAERMYLKVRKELHGLGSDAYKREAARRLGMDVDDYVRLRASKGAAKIAKPVTPKTPKPPMPSMPKVSRVADEWDSIEDDVKAYHQMQLNGTRGGPKPLIDAEHPTPSWSAQKAWMAGDNKGGWPYSPAIRRGMGKDLGIEAHMPDKWPIDAAGVAGEDAWAASFLKAIRAQTSTQPPLFRGMTGHANVNVGDTFDLLPSSWSVDAGSVHQYGDTVYAMKDAYGVGLQEDKLQLDDREVVAGGKLEVVSVRDVEWDQEHKDVFGGPSTYTHRKIRLVEVRQLSRLP